MAAPSSKTALITGATGLLGRQLATAFARAGFSTTGTSFSRDDINPLYTLTKLDLTDIAALGPVLDSVKPAIVIHSAASRLPDVVDKDPAAARLLNIDASKALARECAKRGVLLVYISTDYVFGGRPEEEASRPYGAGAKPAPTNLYGQTKLDGEEAVLAASDEEGTGFVLRVPVLYGPTVPRDNNKESAVNVLIDAVWKAQKEKVVMDDWSVRYPTNTEDVGRVAADLGSKLLALSADERKKVGGSRRVFAFTAEEKMTKFEMCEKLAGILGVPLGHMEANKQGNDPNASVQRPYDCHLSTGELRDLGVDVQAGRFEEWWRRYLTGHR